MCFEDPEGDGEKMLEELYTESHKIFTESFKRFVAREITPYIPLWEERGEVPRELWYKMGEQGFLCPWLPEEFGGMGVGFEYSVIINQELIRGDGFGVGVPLHSDVATPYIYSYGRDEVKQELLPRCTTGEVICAVGFTEPNAGSDLASIRTTATYKNGRYYINGQKTFITNGYFADVIVLAAKTEPSRGYKGISLFAFPTTTKGFTRGRKLKKLGYHAQDTAELFFEDCEVPKEYLLGEENEGFRYMMEKLQQERLEICIKSQTMAEEALKEALSYVKTRVAFGDYIGNHQFNAFRLADMATEVELGRVFLERLILEHIKKRDIVKEVSMAKYWLAEMANRIAYQALQLFGGYGYMEEYRIARIYRDVRCLPIIGGTSEIMRLIISRELGLNPK